MGSSWSVRIEEARQLVASNNFGAAEILLRRIAAGTPDDPDALTLLGITLMRTGREDEAGQRLTEALGKDSKLPEALTWLAALRYRQRQYEDAIRLVDSLLDLTPTNPEALNLLGSCYLGLGKADEAEGCVSK